MQRNAEPARLEFLAELGDAFRERVLDDQREVRHAHIEQGLVIQLSPVVAKGKTRHAKAS